MTRPLRSSAITEPSSLLRGSPSLLQRIGTFGLAVGAACAFSLGIASKVLTFRKRAWSSFTPSTCRMPFGQHQDSPRTYPKGRVTPWFWHQLIRFRHFSDGSLALASLNHTCQDHRPDVSAALTTMAFDHSGLRWLGISDLIVEPEGPTSISPTVARSRVDRLRS